MWWAPSPPCEDWLMHHGIKGQKWGVRNGPPYPLKGFKSPQELSAYMRNFKYREFTTLKSPDEVGRTKSGSCHDQVMYELQQLRRMGLNPKAKFLMEIADNGQGGMTHSFVYWAAAGKINYLENAWGGREGIRQYDSIDQLENAFRRAHQNGSFGNRSRGYTNLEFGDFNDSEHRIGEDLQELVDKCLK